MVICTISLFAIVGCKQDSLIGEYLDKIIIKDNQGIQVEITNKKEIENFDEIVQYESWIELKGEIQDFDSDIIIIESYKSSKNKSREICLNKNSNYIKLIIDGKSTILYKVEDEMSDKIYDRISTILYNHS